ncbi:deoxyribonuclease IV [Tepidibacillus infernus]|uniref:Probable endonuclease 4 n=1 Tax=Tepidibacillus decaturensis TaxID=1413211 RepID=A0A135L4H1_9BACI|nr:MULTISPECIES: deoxyribonuclease IV [Tepidibacillus]KXG43797.1 endonuclease IV [Tepidibacillus decaturensis]GBF11080.1 putative endonuclease 4 [Tepidibacillus sp. HK-1]
MQLGCHISVSKGLEKAAQKAHELGAETFQVFTKNPRGLKPKKVDMKDALNGVEFCKEHGITVICHTPYITNLSTPKEDLQEVTIRSIVEDLNIAEAYGAIGAVVHCGKHVGEGEEYGIKRMIETLDLILEQYDGPVKLLLENTAGQGSELGLAPETLMEIRNNTKYPEKIEFCFDTCHAFAAGQWNEEQFDDFIKRAEEAGYLEHIKVIHFNDSKVPFNSRKDRHEKIGQGEIGAKALQKFLQCEKLEHIPFILETPVTEEEEYKDEIVYLHQLREDMK